MVELEFEPEERNLYMAVEARIRDKINKFIHEGVPPDLIIHYFK